jgi:uncharacterized protein (DUF2164 family)
MTALLTAGEFLATFFVGVVTGFLGWDFFNKAVQRAAFGASLRKSIDEANRKRKGERDDDE